MCSYEFRWLRLPLLYFETDTHVHVPLDHKDAPSYYLKYYSKINTRPEDCKLLRIDAQGMDIQYQDGAKAQTQRIQFETPALYA
jgi:hypothetical protein